MGALHKRYLLTWCNSLLTWCNSLSRWLHLQPPAIEFQSKYEQSSVGKVDRMTERIIKLGDRTFDLETSTLRGPDGGEIALRSQSLRVLSALAEAGGQLVDRDHLIETIWGDIAVTDDSLVQCIRDIRLALNGKDRRLVKTVVGRGYALSADKTNAARTDMPTVFVEPFTSHGDPTVSEDMRDELHETLISRLAPRAGIQVLTSEDHRRDAQYLISGKVQIRDQAVRISFQLSHAAGHAVFFSDSKEARGNRAFELPTDVADAIAAQIRVHMIVNDGEKNAHRSDTELTAQELKAKAAWHMARFQRDNWHAARSALRRACELSPNDPVSLAMSASMATQLIPLIPFNEVQAETQDAMALANRAVELGQSVDYVLRTRGNIRFWLEHDHEGARRDCFRALKLNPAFHLAHLTIAESEIFAGEMEAGVDRLIEMMHRAPFDPQNPLYHSMIAIGEILSGGPEKAHFASGESIELWPTQPWTALVHAIACVAAERSEEAPDASRYATLPSNHFDEMPFVEQSHARLLGELLRTARQLSA